MISILDPILVNLGSDTHMAWFEQRWLVVTLISILLLPVAHHVLLPIDLNKMVNILSSTFILQTSLIFFIAVSTRFFTWLDVVVVPRSVAHVSAG